MLLLDFDFNSFFGRMCRIHSRLVVLFITVFILSGCGAGSFSTSYASGYSVSKPVQCVPYARNVSNIQLYGDAYTWWNQALQKRYSRGFKPKAGSVLVLAKTQKLKHGHVAVVTRIISPRQIVVTHSNWGSDRKSRSVIYDAMRVEDVSKENDWSKVRFWNHDAGTFGFPYPAYGFIYK